jgi:hypothetical protein
MTTKKMHPIPITAARSIAEAYGYDQIVIIGRKVGDGRAGEEHREHVTTYGIDKDHCRLAALQGNALKRFMGWPSRRRCGHGLQQVAEGPTDFVCCGCDVETWYDSKPRNDI